MPAHPPAVPTTRDRVLALLRRDATTVEALSQELGLSDNAVRLHLAALERDGVVQVVATRRDGPGKPANIYGISANADVVLSQAHAPLLRALIDELHDRLSSRELTAILRATGKRAAGRTTHAHGPLAGRAEGAVRQLTALGAQVRVETHGGNVSIESDGCLIGSVVAHHPQACAAIASMVGALTGANAASACDRTGAPRCSFRLTD